jgi:hypothetical protein
MGEGSLGFVVEALVALLLIVTIGYCLVVNRKLERLRSDQSELKEIIRELNAATAHAEHALTGLQKSADNAEDMLAAHVESARDLSTRLSQSIGQGEEVYSKLTMMSQMNARNGSAKTKRAAPDNKHGLRASKLGIGLLNATEAATAPDQQDRDAA